MTLKIRKPYSRERLAINFLDQDGNQAVGRTEQSHKAETDINKIIATYDRTGVLTSVNAAQAFYGDYTVVNEYKEALDFVYAANDHFAEIPATIREKFDNDPGKFMEFVSNPDNLDEMVELGLANPSVQSTPPNDPPSGGENCDPEP